MKNKKLLLLFLTILVLFTLTACKEEEKEPEDKEDIVDMSWKVEYDVVDNSPHFTQSVDTCYQIFPISFADSNGDGKGDINGITQNISYLADTLDIDCIWINPVNTSPSYHKYDVVDYYDIDPEFGTLADYENLLTVAEDNGIKVLMDFVINHTSIYNPWFTESRKGEDNEYRDWYVWNDLTDKTKYPSKNGWSFTNGMFYYASFWHEMPELNFDNQEVRTEIKKIAEFWLNKGVDGFRIDAAKHIYDTNEFPRGTKTLTENINWFKEFNHFVKEINPDAFVVGEIASNTSTYVDNYFDGMDSAFNFEYAEDLIYAIQAGYNSKTIESLVTARENYAKVRPDYIDSIFLSNHDQERIFDKVGYSVEKVELAAQMLFTLPGISWVYYGEELGMSGINPHESIRQPFIWADTSSYHTTGQYKGISDWDDRNKELDGVAEQLLDDNSLLNSYIELIQLKKNNDALRHGEIVLIDNEENAIMGYVMETDTDKLLVLHNISAIDRTVNIDLTTHSFIYNSDDYTLESNVLTMTPHSTLVIEVDTTEINITK